ncbi:MAG: FIG00685563: hypothetical protein, partial [uncultured Gemmatimonadetes bacterium]
VRHARTPDRHLLRAPGVVPPPLRGAGPARHAVRQDPRGRAPLRPRRGAEVLARLQPDEPLRVQPRPRQLDLLHHLVPGLPARERHPRGERVRRVAHRDLQGAPARAAGAARAAVPQGARHQPPLAGAGRGRGAALPHRDQAQHRRERRGSAALRHAGGAGGRRRGRRPAAGDRLGGAGAGVHPAGGEPHRARGGAGRRVPVRHPHLHPRQLLRPVPRGRLPAGGRGGAGRADLRRGRAQARPARGGLRAPRRDPRAGGGHHGRRAHRRGRDRVHDRLARWAALLLRHQRPLQLRGRRAQRDRLRPVRAARGLPGGAGGDRGAGAAGGGAM